MISILSLWLPILLSAIAVFIVSSVIHMFLKYHSGNFTRVPDEEVFRAAVRPLAIPPGEYSVPFMTGMDDMGKPEFKTKMEEGPVLIMTVMPNLMFNMGKPLGFWFLYSLVVGVFAAYLAGFALPPGADYMAVFRVTGTVAFLAYGFAMIQDSIWFARKISSTLKYLFDALIYALLTAGIFGWLWPAA